MNLRDLVPPVLVEMLRRFRRGGSKLFDSYESALAECVPGYQREAVVAVVYEKTRRYRDTLTQRPLALDLASLGSFAGLCLTLPSGKELNVIDFGGACGAHYFLAKALLRDRVGLRWHVVETSSMARTAVRLEEGGLKFYDNLEKAREELNRVDAVFTSFALPYVPQPYEALERLTECGAASIFLTRIPLSALSREVIAIQTCNLSANGPGPMPEGMKDGIMRYPIIFARKDKFEDILRRDYDIEIQFNESKGFCFHGRHSIDMYGYFGLRRAART